MKLIRSLLVPAAVFLLASVIASAQSGLLKMFEKPCQWHE